MASTEYRTDGSNWNQYSVPFDIITEGTTTLQYRSIDNEGNVESSKTLTIKIDKTLPEIVLNSPSEGGVYLLDHILFADWSAIDSISGLAYATGNSPDGEVIDTSVAGHKTFTVTATDNAYLTYQLVVNGIPGNEVEPLLNNFIYLSEDNLYLLELDTTGMAAGVYQINVYPDDGAVYNARFTLKR